ncbi:MAG TPA: DUF6127 family protein [Cellvibrionaceae bacterium]|nr:DUF6127 family protein [Cellvibrionaceae bacterium]
MTTPAPASPNDTPLYLRPDDLDDLLTRAAERGAERVLAHLGLENGHAARDIRDLRDLVEAWREARHTAWQTFIKIITTSVLMALILGAAFKLKILGDGQ